MAKALFLLTDNTLKVVEPHIARKAYDMLTGEIEPDERQAEFLNRIKRIFLPPSVRPASYTAVAPYESKTPARAAVRGSGDENDIPRQDDLRLSGKDYDERYK